MRVRALSHASAIPQQNDGEQLQRHRGAQSVKLVLNALLFAVFVVVCTP